MTAPKKESEPRKNREYGANICFGCTNACGGCEWSEVDPDTGHPRFQPVPGWTAEPVLLAKDRKGRETMTFHITACPKLVPLKRTTMRVSQSYARRPDTRNRMVVAISGDGTETTYPSIEDAIEATGANRGRIQIACKTGKTSSGGLRWRYARNVT